MDLPQRSSIDKKEDVRGRKPWWRLLRCVVVVLVAFPVTSFAVYQLFLYLYSPPSQDATTAWTNTQQCSRNINPNQVVDDACRTCEVNELEVVQLCVQTDGAKFIGHAFIKTASFATGFRTHERDIGLVDYLWPWATSHPGYIRNDDDSQFDFFLSLRVCPSTRERLLESIYQNAVAPYQVGNWGNGRNCATWATDRLRDAGLPAPPGDCPNRMARSMRAVAKEANSTVAVTEVNHD